MRTGTCRLFSLNTGPDLKDRQTAFVRQHHDSIDSVFHTQTNEHIYLVSAGNDVLHKSWNTNTQLHSVLFYTCVLCAFGVFQYGCYLHS